MRKKRNMEEWTREKGAERAKGTTHLLFTSEAARAFKAAVFEKKEGLAQVGQERNEPGLWKTRGWGRASRMKSLSPGVDNYCRRIHTIGRRPREGDGRKKENQQPKGKEKAHKKRRVFGQKGILRKNCARTGIGCMIRSV